MMLLEPTAVAAQVLYDDYQQVLADSAREDAKQLEATLKTVESQLQNWQNGSRQTRSGALQSDVVKLKRQVQQFDDSVQTDFDNTLQHLKDQQLPETVIQRHLDTVAEYQANVNTLLANLDSLINAETEAAITAQLETTLQHLQPLLTQGHHAEFDPNNLPFSIPSADNTRAPLEDATALKDLFPQSRQVRSSNAPSNDDLAATEDVQITPAIEELAQSLEHNPVKIYNWVHDNIQYIPTHGSIQGSQLTLDNGAGNAVDTASLLIALLRASGIHARYAYGTVRIPVEQAMNWVGGVTAPEAAVQLLAQGGIPSVTSQTQQGKITHVKMEHVWVDAWVDFVPSRGAVNKTGDTWVSMDASFKQYEFTEGMDLQNEVAFDAEGFVNHIRNTSIQNEDEGWVQNVDHTFIQNQLQSYQTQIETYLQQNNPDAIDDEILRNQIVISSNRTQLAASLPYTLLQSGNQFTTLPNSMRHHFSFALYRSVVDQKLDNPVFHFQHNLTELASKRVTFSFKPATEADQKLIESYLPELAEGDMFNIDDLPDSLPGYLIRLTAEFKVDGEVVYSAGGFKMGQELYTTTKISRVTGGEYSAENKPIAGEYYVIGINPQGISNTYAASIQGQYVEDVLEKAVLSYFQNNDFVLNKMSQIGQAIGYRLPSFGTFSTSLQPIYRFGIPQDVGMSGILVDMDVIAQSLWSINNDAEVSRQAAQQVGLLSSAFEHLVPEHFFTTQEYPGEGVSAVKALGIANQQGQKIYQISQENIEVLLPLVKATEDTKQDIISFVNAGNGVIVHEENITVDGWTGIGYITTDPITGAGAYRITGGDNGGALKPSNLKVQLKKAVKEGLRAIVNMLLPKDPCDSGGSLLLSVLAIMAVFTVILVIVKANPMLSIAGKALDIRKAMSQALTAALVLASTNAMADDDKCKPSKADCKKTKKILKQAHTRLSQKYGVNLSSERVATLKAKVLDKSISSIDLPGTLQREIPIKGKTLAEVEEMCK